MGGDGSDGRRGCGGEGGSKWETKQTVLVVGLVLDLRRECSARGGEGVEESEEKEGLARRVTWSSRSKGRGGGDGIGAEEISVQQAEEKGKVA